MILFFNSLQKNGMKENYYSLWIVIFYRNVRKCIIPHHSLVTIHICSFCFQNDLRSNSYVCFIAKKKLAWRQYIKHKKLTCRGHRLHMFRIAFRLLRLFEIQQLWFLSTYFEIQLTFFHLLTLPNIGGQNIRKFWYDSLFKQKFQNIRSFTNQSKY